MCRKKGEIEMQEHKFFRCTHCGNLVGMIQNAGVPIICCGEPMQELTANTTDGAAEKHLPIVSVNGDTVLVSVGAAKHPMQQEHQINWIYLQTEHGGQRKSLRPAEVPEAKFRLVGDRPIAAFAYCNLHGLWKTDLL